MKKIIFGLVLVACMTVSMTSCRQVSQFKNNFKYKSPDAIGGLWTVEQNGIKIEHLKCVYWSTEDDDSVFEMQNGKKIFVNGSSVIFQE